MATWCSAEVVTAWRRFIEAVHGKDVPTDVLEMMIKLDHAILTELAKSFPQRAARARHRPLKSPRNSWFDNYHAV